MNFKVRGRLFASLLAMVLALSAAPKLDAQTVKTLGGDGAGNANGDTFNVALFHTPFGLALDSAGQYIYLADRDNNALRLLNLPASTTTGLSFPGTNIFTKPVGVILDANNDIFVLNFGNGKNGNLVGIGPITQGAPFLGVITSGLTNVGGITLDSAGNFLITSSNSVLKITPAGVKTTVATVGISGAALQGLVYRHNGMVAVCDSGRNGIYNINPATGLVTTNAGFNGKGDFVTNGFNVTPAYAAKFNQPHGIAEAGDGTLLVADYGNNRCKVITTTGTVTNLYGITRKFWNNSTPPGVSGWEDGTVVVPDSSIPNVQADEPNGIIIGPDATVYTTEDGFDLVRKVTGAGLATPPALPPPAPAGLNATAIVGQVTLSWPPSTGATNYNVKRSPSTGGPYSLVGSTAATSYVDTTVQNGVTYYYVVTALNASGESSNSVEAVVTVPLPPVPDPLIGYVNFVIVNSTESSVLQHGLASYDLNNDALIVIQGTPGTSTYYTYGFTTNVSAVPNPTNSSGSVPSDYVDGLQPFQVTPYVIAQVAPSVTIKAIGMKSDGSPNSAVAATTFNFITGNPVINGLNAALFTISDVTTGAQLYYTLDGTDPSPTNGVNLGLSTNSTNTWTVSLNISTNTLFEVRAFKNNYQPSQIATIMFASSNIVANTISFGFANGEASSSFIGAPGQTFYAPVTLTTLPGTTIYDLSFNISLSNVGGSPAPIAGAYDFTSMLLTPIASDIFTNIPPAMFVGPGFTNLDLINTNLNTIGLFWVERAGETNLYDTTRQTLLTYSQAHDDQFPNKQNPNGVIIGGYGFQIPPNATPGQQYQIQINRVSASSDGIGAPASSVFIYTPTNGSFTGGAINSIKTVTAGESIYLVGDAYPFRWFNAGDFGSGELVTNGINDVLQVFESAVYGLNTPPTATDFYDCMDSAGDMGTFDNAHGYYVDGGALSAGQQAALFNNNDPSEVNANMFGDGVLDVSDVYVTATRSIFGTNANYNLLWVQRFWTNGVRGALYTANPSLTLNQATPHVAISHAQANTTLSSTNQPKVVFTAGDIPLATGGTTVQIPINATVYGTYPLRVLLLNLTVVPLDGSPALTNAVSFIPTSSLGAPTTGFTEQRGLGNYSGAWLSNSVAGLTGTTTIGVLNITLPGNATASSSYAIHFDHASGSPSGFASFPKQTITGLITFANRTNSFYGDGIPDSWRLRYFGTVYNYLSVSNADADGDGYDNWHEYVAGTDPNDPASRLNVSANNVAQGQPGTIQWPSVANKQYSIQRSATLFPGVWSTIATVTGSGNTMQFNDTVTGQAYYYRVQVK